jgi:hypothetical protein
MCHQNDVRNARAQLCHPLDAIIKRLWREVGAQNGGPPCAGASAPEQIRLINYFAAIGAHAANPFARLASFDHARDAGETSCTMSLIIRSLSPADIAEKLQPGGLIL